MSPEVQCTDEASLGAPLMDAWTKLFPVPTPLSFLSLCHVLQDRGGRSRGSFVQLGVEMNTGGAVQPYSGIAYLSASKGRPTRDLHACHLRLS